MFPPASLASLPGDERPLRTLDRWQYIAMIDCFGGSVGGRGHMTNHPLENDSLFDDDLALSLSPAELREGDRFETVDAVYILGTPL